MEYQCFYLSENYKLAHEDDAEVLFESDNLGSCLVFVYNKFRAEGKSIAVYQPRHGSYREWYRAPILSEDGYYCSEL
jgi:hypothetical protein